VQYNYIGKTCPFCQFTIKSNRGAVLCPVCKVPHHKACWEENKGCTTFGCKETTFISTTQGRMEMPSGTSANNQTVPASANLNTFLAVALTVSFFIIVVLTFILTANQPVKQASPVPQTTQQTTQQNTTQTTKKTEEDVYYVITEPGSNLFIRRSPGRDNKKDSDIITKVPRGTQFAVTNNHGNSVKKDGYTWWEIRVVQSGITGWVAAEYISTNPNSVRK
jgi:hypothetical protein